MTGGLPARLLLLAVLVLAEIVATYLGYGPAWLVTLSPLQWLNVLASVILGGLSGVALWSAACPPARVHKKGR